MARNFFAVLKQIKFVAAPECTGDKYLFFNAPLRNFSRSDIIAVLMMRDPARRDFTPFLLRPITMVYSLKERTRARANT